MMNLTYSFALLGVFAFCINIVILARQAPLGHPSHRLALTSVGFGRCFPASLPATEANHLLHKTWRFSLEATCLPSRHMLVFENCRRRQSANRRRKVDKIMRILRSPCSCLDLMSCLIS
ncbi:hypothetical protein K435DRAFT_481288 [Dendrothele bispora CBS 962.96]|uniref:Uncharacterized protein n=1 Tax=Dendrothele bispora (strain CBS 962.96) TaxID=1314807 RepID=A0A4S8MTH6_DENBC|nr:hypothetical protein K435DRAFT_481288 [Dendrothele bispora CBS 962.96]